MNLAAYGNDRAAIVRDRDDMRPWVRSGLPEDGPHRPRRPDSAGQRLAEEFSQLVAEHPEFLLAAMRTPGRFARLGPWRSAF